MSVRVGVDIHGNPLGAIAAFKLVQHEMRATQRVALRSMAVTRTQAAQTREFNRLLADQRMHLQRLTLDYVAVRRAVLSLGIRGAVTGFAALSSAAGGAATAVASLAAELALLSTALAIGAGATLTAAIQGFGVLKLALNDVGKAMFATGTAADNAYEKLTKPAKAFVDAMRPLRKELHEVKLLAQDGIFPGLTRAAADAMKVMPTLKQVVHDTAQTWGFLAEESAKALVRQDRNLMRFGQRNILTMRRLGEAAIGFGEGFLEAHRIAEPLIGRMTRDIKRWGQEFRRWTQSERGENALAKLFSEARRAWLDWTSVFGDGFRGIVNTIEAGLPTFHKMTASIRESADHWARWSDSKAGQERMSRFFERTAPVAGEFSKSIGATVAMFGRLAEAGAPNMERIFRAYRTRLLPVIEDLAKNLDRNLLPAIIDFGREMLDVFEAARPAITFFTDAIALALRSVSGLLDILNQGGPGGALVLGAAVILGWGRFKLLLEGVLLRMRQLVGLAPRMATLVPTGAAGGGGGGGPVSAPVAVGSIGPRPTASGGQVNPVVTQRAGSFTGPRFSFLQMGARPGIGSTGFYGGRTSLSGQGGQFTPLLRLPRSVTMTRPGGRFPVFITRPSRTGPVRFLERTATGGERLMPPMAPMMTATRGGLPLNGPSNQFTRGRQPLFSSSGFVRPGRFAAQRSVLSQMAFGLPGTIGAGVAEGVEKARPKIAGAFKLGAAAGVFSGAVNALSQAGSELGGGFRGIAKNFVSGLTFGAVPGTDQEAAERSQSALDALRAGGRFQGSGSDLSTGRGIAEWRRTYLDVLLEGKDITKAQHDLLTKAADHYQRVFTKVESLGMPGLKIDPADVKGPIDKMLSSFRALREGVGLSGRDIRRHVRIAGRDIREHMAKGSDSAKSALAKNFDLAIKAVRRNMREGGKITREGMALIERLMAQKLQVYGFTARQARLVAGGKSYTGGREEGQSGFGKARGGMLQRIGSHGSAAGPDTVPLTVGRGEDVAVFNRHQREAIDQRLGDVGGLSGFFQRYWPKHSQAGGAPVRLARGGIVALGKKLQNMGYHVSEHPAFGGVAPGVHAPGGWHYKAGALDVNADHWPGGEMAALDKLAAWLRARGWHYLWRVANHFDHLHVDVANGQGTTGGGFGAMLKKIPRVTTGLPGMLGQAVQGALDMTRGAANEHMQRSVMESGGVGVGGFASAGKKALMNAWVAAGGAPKMANLMAAIALAESGGNPRANNAGLNANGTTDHGAWQINDIWSKVFPKLWGQRYSLIGNAKMAVKILAKQGLSAWSTYNRSDHLQFLARGGLFDAIAAETGYPPRNDGYPDVGSGTPGSTPRSRADDTPKTGRKKRKPKPHYRGSAKGAAQAIAMSKMLLAKKARSKKLGVRPRLGKWAKLLKGTGWKGDPTGAIDPLTGEQMDIGGVSYFAKRGLPDILKRIEGWEAGLEQMLHEHGLSDEQFVLTDAFGTEHLNLNGMRDPITGAWVPGINQALAEWAAQTGLRGNLATYYSHAKGATDLPGIEKAIARRRKKLAAMKAWFVSNKRVIRAKREAIRKASGNNWKGQIRDNDRVIDRLQDHLRLSSNLPDSYTRKVRDDIDTLQDLNKSLRDKKPKKAGGMALARLHRIHDQRVEENELLGGKGNAMAPYPPPGGYIGRTINSLALWGSMRDYATDGATQWGEARTTHLRAIDEIGKLVAAAKLIPGTKLQTPVADAQKEARDALLREMGLDALRQGNADRLGFGVLRDFAQLVGARTIGSFAHGAVMVPQTGLALVHRGESIHPDPDGPFRSGMTASRIGQDGGTYVTLVLRDRAGELVELIDQRVEGRAQHRVSVQTGQRSRLISAAPGRGR